nr:AT-rich interactive domain-containing protein 1B-like [Salvelinus alpinus]
MAAQVASAPTITNNKNKKLSGNLGQEIHSGKSGGGNISRSGEMLGAVDGTNTMNNVDHHHRHELNMVNSTYSPNNNSDTPEKESGNNVTSSDSTTSPGGMETGLIENHKLKNVGSGDPPQHLTPPQQQSQFNPFPQHQQRQIQSNNNNNSQATRGESENHHHGGKEGVLGSQPEQQMLSKGEGDHTCKPGERMGARYEHSNLGPTTNNIISQPQSAGGNNEFNNYYGTSRVGPCYDQHGGQQSTGMGMMHSSGPNNMDPVHNSQEGYHNSHYNHYSGYRQGYCGASYGMMAPSRQGSNMLIGPGSNTPAGHVKAAMGAAACGSGGSVGGFQRFPGQSQHPTGATPTLNQLLTSPSPMMRGYGSGYQDYNSPSAQQQDGIGLGKDMTSQYGSTTHGWPGQQRNHPSMSPGNGGPGISRPQVASKDFMAMKRSQLYGMGNNPYSQQQQGGPYPNQPYGSPTPHRYPMGMQGRGQVGIGGMQYPQQQQGPSQYGQQGIGGYSQQQQQQQGTTPGPYFSPPQQNPTPPPPDPTSAPPSRTPPPPLHSPPTCHPTPHLSR